MTRTFKKELGFGFGFRFGFGLGFGFGFGFAKPEPNPNQVTRTFKREYPAKELESLWGALLKCYGTKERALAAVRANPQVSTQ